MVLSKNDNKGIASLEKVLPTVQVKAWKIWNDKILQYPSHLKAFGQFHIHYRIKVLQLKAALTEQ